ncbi:hypothetical protein EI42_03578 [Thermosporothrix hazakensis]|jgi:hypothetical protein|uniref:Uncharacterized protein n=2 Tax=Thermosporothrix TaxID=768650 RepID=A0A326U5C7_THEHA|nr:hypothetical protein [Thermosporothrix hazakensis]PZW27491.1 hypothetical protein EI42_03578 [Thermosporothrix hazakensis]BBH85917.1 hypothetical protein KTC_06680 [Thermosporothrix sp. COM3]GCE45657.1 hypothetical protein KTH_05260 [Thermosporothrix hazakensis]
MQTSRPDKLTLLISLVSFFAIILTFCSLSLSLLTLDMAIALIWGFQTIQYANAAVTAHQQAVQQQKKFLWYRQPPVINTLASLLLMAVFLYRAYNGNQPSSAIALILGLILGVSLFAYSFRLYLSQERK